jgi:hypothetical protein
MLLTMGETRVKVCYSRPSARDRTIFGELVPYGRVWRTGANEPTMLHLSGSAEVAGVELEAGSYLLFTIPGQEEWAVVFNTSEATTPEGMFRDMAEVGRGTVPVEQAEDHVEEFTITGAGTAKDAEIVLEWERVRVRVPVRTPE